MKREDIILGALLCFAGGAMDGYSYCMQGGVLAAAQTGNLLLLTLHIVEGKWSDATGYLISLLCFILAVFLTRLVQERLFSGKTLTWRKCFVWIEFFVFTVIGYCGARIPSFTVIAAISFLATIQYCTFRSFGEGAPYATVFCTGNIRSLMDNVYDGTVGGDVQSRKRAGGYVIMLSCFALGAACSGLLSKIVKYHAIWLSCMALLGAEVILSIRFCRKK